MEAVAITVLLLQQSVQGNLPIVTSKQHLKVLAGLCGRESFVVFRS